MSSAHDTLTKLLKQHGYSITKPRLAVFNALLGHESVAMHELVEAISDTDRASVYRTVALYEELGIVQRITIGWKYRLELSDAFSDHHHHLSCTVCGRTTAMNESELEQLIGRISAKHHFKPNAHQIEIQGVCQACQAGR